MRYVTHVYQKKTYVPQAELKGLILNTILACGCGKGGGAGTQPKYRNAQAATPLFRRKAPGTGPPKGHVLTHRAPARSKIGVQNPLGIRTDTPPPQRHDFARISPICTKLQRAPYTNAAFCARGLCFDVLKTQKRLTRRNDGPWTSAGQVCFRPMTAMRDSAAVPRRFCNVCFPERPSASGVLKLA